MQIEAEIEEDLILAIQDLQVEKQGKATLDDITQEWIDMALPNYSNKVTEDVSINVKRITIQKNEVVKKYIIDDKLKLTETNNGEDIEFSYDVGERIGEKVKILIHIQEQENGLTKIELPDKDTIIVESNKKEEKAIDYEVEIGKEYKIKITSESGKTEEKIILIKDYWYKVTKNLAEGINIDNLAVKAAYNKPYEATISKKPGYILETITVTMGGQPVTVDITTGKIEIEKVTGDIEITATVIDFRFKTVSTTNNHCLALDMSGNLYAWGRNDQGQVGNGTTSSTGQTSLVQIKNGTKFKEISAGGAHSLAIDESGNLWTWGRNYNGQLGIGTAGLVQKTPIQITSGTEFKFISAAGEHNLAIDEEGNLFTWGYNYSGQLGDGTTTDRRSRQLIKSGTKFKAAAAGNAHSLAIDESGNLWAWGSNQYGQIGSGTTTTKQTTLVQIQSGTKFKAVAAGMNHSLAIDESGNLWAWGYNNKGQIGNGTIENQTIPVQINSGTKFKEIKAGYEHSLAIDENGNLWAWGYNGAGQFGNGTITDSKIPVQIQSETKFKVIAAGQNHSLGIDEVGNLFAWGYNNMGQIGNVKTTDSTSPVQIKSAIKFKEISVRHKHSIGIDESGNLFGWGVNSNGQLGNGTTTDSNVPIQIKEGTKFNKISAGYYHNLGIDEDGNLWAWGKNNYGQLGNGTTTDSTIPVQIKYGTKFKAVSAGQEHSLGIDDDGNLWAWGYNGIGQLGNGTTTDSTIPVQIQSGTKFKAVAVGNNHSLAIDESGNLFAWGYNSSGELGDGTTTQRTSPVQIQNGTKFKAISGEKYHSLVIDELGNLYGMGNVYYLYDKELLALEPKQIN